jgi:hypothetical protein
VNFREKVIIREMDEASSWHNCNSRC